MIHGGQVTERAVGDKTSLAEYWTVGLTIFGGPINPSPSSSTLQV